MCVQVIAAACPDRPTPGERLVLDGLRSWASSRMDGGAPEIAVQRIVAWRASERVGAFFVAWMRAVEEGRRRPIEIHCVHCHGASIDEQRLVAALGVAAIDPDLGEALLEPLLVDPGVVITLARALNGALAASGLPVPARLRTEPIPPPRSEATVH